MPVPVGPAGFVNCAVGTGVVVATVPFVRGYPITAALGWGATGVVAYMTVQVEIQVEVRVLVTVLVDLVS